MPKVSRHHHDQARRLNEAGLKVSPKWAYDQQRDGLGPAAHLARSQALDHWRRLHDLRGAGSPEPDVIAVELAVEGWWCRRLADALIRLPGPPPNLSTHEAREKVAVCVFDEDRIAKGGAAEWTRRALSGPRELDPGAAPDQLSGRLALAHSNETGEPSPDAGRADLHQLGATVAGFEDFLASMAISCRYAGTAEVAANLAGITGEPIDLAKLRQAMEEADEVLNGETMLTLREPLIRRASSDLLLGAVRMAERYPWEAFGMTPGKGRRERAQWTAVASGAVLYDLYVQAGLLARQTGLPGST